MSALHDIRSAAHARASMSAAQAVWDSLEPDDNSLAESVALESCADEIIQELLEPGALHDFCSARLDGAEWTELLRAVTSALAEGPGKPRYIAAMEVLGPHIDAAAEERMSEAQDHD